MTQQQPNQQPHHDQPEPGHVMTKAQHKRLTLAHYLALAVLAALDAEKREQQ